MTKSEIRDYSWSVFRAYDSCGFIEFEQIFRLFLLFTYLGMLSNMLQHILQWKRNNAKYMDSALSMSLLQRLFCAEHQLKCPLNNLLFRLQRDLLQIFMGIIVILCCRDHIFRWKMATLSKIVLLFVAYNCNGRHYSQMKQNTA